MDMKTIITGVALAAVLAAGTVWGDTARICDRGRFATMDGAFLAGGGGDGDDCIGGDCVVFP